MTAAGAVPHRELDHITIVELIPEVLDAVRLLAKENLNIVDEQRTKVIVDDARHYLKTSNRTFDVIVADLFVPWESQTGYLYTVEHFEAAKSRLRQEGVFCQWLPLYQLGIADFEMIADSLRQVFPHVTLWWGRLDATRPILALIATENTIAIDDTTTNARLKVLGKSGLFDDSMLASTTRFVELYAGDWPLNRTATLNTDEQPWVEFNSPISHKSDQLLCGARLRNYLRDRVEHYPSTSLQYHQIEGTPTPLNRNWQRLVMFPEP